MMLFVLLSSGLGDGGTAHDIQVAGVCGQGCGEGAVSVADPAHRFTNRVHVGSERPVYCVREAGGQMVLDLMVKAPEKPGCVPAQGPGVVIKINCGCQLVLHGGIPNQTAGVAKNETGALHTVGELEDYSEGETNHPRAQQIGQQNQMDRVQHHRQQKSPGKMGQFTQDHDCRISPEVYRAGLEALAVLRPREEISDEHPLQRQKTIEEPEIQVLVLVPGTETLAWGEAGERGEFNIVVVSHNIGPVVVRDVVVHPPQPGTGAEKVCRIRDYVIHSPAAGEGPVVGIVHDSSSNRQDRMDQGDGGQNFDEPVSIQENQNGIRNREKGHGAERF